MSARFHLKMEDAIGFPYKSLGTTGEVGEQLHKARPRRRRLGRGSEKRTMWPPHGEGQG